MTQPHDLVGRTQPGQGLKRELGLPHVFSIAAGAMISSGLFVLPALAYARAGPSVVLAYLAAGLLMIPSMFSVLELATAMPRAGGTYFFVERSLGSAAGVVSGISDWFTISMKAAFALIGIGAFAELVHSGVTELEIKLIAIGFCAVFTVLNLLSVRGTARLQVVLVVGLVTILLLFLVRGFESVDVHRYSPFFHRDRGFLDFAATTGLVFISYGGLTKVAGVSEEVRQPGKTLVSGILLAFVVVNVLYILVVFVTVGLLDREVLMAPLMLTPIATASRVTMGTFGVVVTSIGAMLAFVTTANAGIMAASRSPMAMSRDGLLPAFFGRTSTRFGTPYRSVLTTGAFMAVAIAVLPIELLVKSASTMLLLLFILLSISVIVMRESRLSSYRPVFRSPLYPWPQVVGILAYGGMLALMGPIPLLITLGFLVTALIWYLIYVRIRVTRESALVHVVERLTARELAGDGLGRELREILLRRDQVTEDRFDHLVRQADILDIAEALSDDGAFERVAQILAPRLDVPPDVMRRMLLERERISSTVIRPGLAIPHVVVPGKARFEILPVRARQGITFPGTPEPVHTVFVLAGSADQRNYHLRALMAIAQIAQEPEFDTRWMRARGVEELRSILLLSNRERSVPRCVYGDPLQEQA